MYGQSVAVSEVAKVGTDWNLGLGTRFGDILVLNFLKNIRGAATMAAAPLIMRLVVRRRGRTFGWSLWTRRLSLGGLLGDEN